MSVEGPLTAVEHEVVILSLIRDGEFERARALARILIDWFQNNFEDCQRGSELFYCLGISHAIESFRDHQQDAESRRLARRWRRKSGGSARKAHP